MTKAIVKNNVVYCPRCQQNNYIIKSAFPHDSQNYTITAQCRKCQANFEYCGTETDRQIIPVEKFEQSYTKKQYRPKEIKFKKQGKKIFLFKRRG